MLTIGATVATYISMYYLGTYAVKYLGMAQAYGYAAMLLAGLVTFGGSLLVGHWCDRYGRLPLIRGSRIAILIVALPAFWWLSAVPHPAVLLLIVAVLVGLTTLGSVPTMLMISELFRSAFGRWGLPWSTASGWRFSAASLSTSLRSRSR